jgi:hypothetical protein
MRGSRGRGFKPNNRPDGDHLLERDVRHVKKENDDQNLNLKIERLDERPSKNNQEVKILPAPSIN